MNLKKKIKAQLGALFHHFYESDPHKHVINIVWRNAREDSARFVADNLAKALLFHTREEIWAYVFDLAAAQGLLLEFGVASGRSIRFFGQKLLNKEDKRTLYGFDSFIGLQEDWVGHFRPQGSYDQAVLPSVKDNTVLIEGWVQDTVPGFLEEHKEEAIAFMHIDTDTFTPCEFLLEETYARWRVGTIILFDELQGYPGWLHGEYKALQEFGARHPHIKYEYVAFSDKQAAIRITAL